MLQQAFLLVIFVTLAATSPIEITPFVVNGTDARIEEFPFLVSLQWRFNDSTFIHYCGGTILNKDWVLTAAHCLNDDDPTTNQIEYGTTVISHGSKGINTVYFERTIIHEKFDPFTLFHDIGLIKTKSPMTIVLFEYKVKLPIPSDYFSTGTPAVLAGWGRTGTDAEISTILQKVSYQIYSQSDCADLHEEEIHYNNICAGIEGGYKGQCKGDSGGPLLVDGVQVGIVSWSNKPCAEPPYPGIMRFYGCCAIY
ncbi:hypothetical protein ACKWTF_013047 [Chironomus riparius]